MKLTVNKDNIEEVSSMIETLLAKRADYIRGVDVEEGFREKYFVFNNDLGEVDDEVFVLRPLDGDADIQALKTFCNNKSVNHILRLKLMEWLKGYTDYKCISAGRGVCKIVGSPICCAHCNYNASCILKENTPICPYVEIGDVVNIEDCEEGDYGRQV